jgi:hypothetical protein
MQNQDAAIAMARFLPEPAVFSAPSASVLPNWQNRE